MELTPGYRNKYMDYSIVIHFSPCLLTKGRLLFVHFTCTGNRNGIPGALTDVDLHSQKILVEQKGGADPFDKNGRVYHL
jgi:hypothetical protein